MTEDAIDHWLTLARLPGVGPQSQNAILACYASPEAYLGASESDRRAKGLTGKAVTAPRQIDALATAITSDRQWQDGGPDRFILPRDDARYPPQLLRIADPPAVLFVRGQLETLREPQIAIVGSRHASANGIQTAEEFAAHLAAAGLVVTSGLALGIDAAAHAGALAVEGRTLAVMATGPNRLYPRENQALAQSIVTQGAIVTEMGTDTPIQRGLFPRRNRIISGLSLGVVVIEAGIKSGALGTAYAGLEQGREVMAVPGSIHNPVARGCHRLIRDGSKLVENATHVIEEIAHLQGAAGFDLDQPDTQVSPQNTRAEPSDTLDEDYQAVLHALGYDPLSFDVLVERTGLTPDILSSMLLSLELKGYVVPCNGGRYMQTNKRTDG